MTILKALQFSRESFEKEFGIPANNKVIHGQSMMKGRKIAEWHKAEQIKLLKAVKLEIKEVKRKAEMRKEYETASEKYFNGYFNALSDLSKELDIAIKE